MVKAKSQKASYAKNPKYGDLIKRMAALIEMTYDSFDITICVAEVNNLPNQIEFRFEVALGTPLESITKLHKDLAIALASQTGDVEIEAPVPGTCLVALRVPVTLEWVDSQIKNHRDPIAPKRSEFPKTFREYLAAIFYIIQGILDITSVFLRKLGNFIEGKEH